MTNDDLKRLYSTNAEPQRNKDFVRYGKNGEIITEHDATENNDVVNYRTLIKHAGEVSTVIITLKSADWVNGSQTKNISVVNADSMIWVSPAPNGSTGNDFMSAGIYVSEQGSGTLTFTAASTPMVDIDIKVIINNVVSGNVQVDNTIYVNQTQENVSQVGDTLNIGGN